MKDTVQELVDALCVMTTSILERITDTWILRLKLKPVTSDIFLTIKVYVVDLFLTVGLVIERTCCSLSGQRVAPASEVLSNHLQVVGGAGQQVVQSVRRHVTHEEIHGRRCAWKTDKKRLKHAGFIHEELPNQTLLIVRTTTPLA